MRITNPGDKFFKGDFDGGYRWSDEMRAFLEAVGVKKITEDRYPYSDLNQTLKGYCSCCKVVRVWAKTSNGERLADTVCYECGGGLARTSWNKKCDFTPNHN